MRRPPPLAPPPQPAYGARPLAGACARRGAPACATPTRCCAPWSAAEGPRAPCCMPRGGAGRTTCCSCCSSSPRRPPPRQTAVEGRHWSRPQAGGMKPLCACFLRGLIAHPPRTARMARCVVNDSLTVCYCLTTKQYRKCRKCRKCSNINIIIIIIKRRSGMNPIPPTVKDREYKKKQETKAKEKD